MKREQIRDFVPRESAEQEALMDWANRASGKWPELALLYHIPNGGSRNEIEAVHLRRQGVKAGVPDLCLPVARGGCHGLYIELKRREGGRISANQSAWLMALNAQGYAAVVCNGWEEAKSTIESYLKGEEL